MRILLTVLIMGLALSLLLWVGLQLAGIKLPLHLIYLGGVVIAAILQLVFSALMSPSPSPEQSVEGQDEHSYNRAFPQPQTPFNQQNPIAVIRAPRGGGVNESKTRSWFGGTPVLGTVAWPLDGNSAPKHLLAQLDMAELQAAAPNPYLPKTGALCFFANAQWPMNGTVIYSAHPDFERPNRLPQGAIPPFSDDDWRSYFPGLTDAEKPLFYPKWPVHFVPLPLEGDYEYDDLRNAVANQFPPSAEFFLGCSFLNEFMVEEGQSVVFWDAGHKLANELRHALSNLGATRTNKEKSIQLTQESIATKELSSEKMEYFETLLSGHEADLKILHERADQFEAFVVEVAEFAFAHDRLDRVSPKGLAWFDAIYKAINTYGSHPSRGVFANFVDTYSFNYKRLEDLRIDSLISMANGTHEGFLSLPAAAQQEIDTHYNRPTGNDRLHQMFGKGTNVQGAASDNAHQHLLLQLQYDKMLNWVWGDMGVIQFWISEEDLRAKRWDNVHTTMEAH